MLVDDSGIDSGDKMEVLKTSDSDEETDIFTKINDFDVIFKNPSASSSTKRQENVPTAHENEEHRNHSQRAGQINTCKILQRKLELKVERAKRNYKQLVFDEDKV